MNKPTDDEEKYFHDESLRQLAELKGEIVVSESDKMRWLELAKTVGSDNVNVGRNLDALGFNSDTARILFFVPLIEIAWADGKIGYEESYKIVDVVRHRGIRATSQAYDMLSSLTLRRPSEDFFNQCNDVIRQLLAAMPADQREGEISNLTDLTLSVAKASRGFFGFGAEVSKEERDVISEIIGELGLEASDHARELLKQL